MLMGRTDALRELGSSKDLSLSDPVLYLNEGEEAESLQHILYLASFEELASKLVQYDTIIWILISLVLVLAWGIGFLMLLFLPVRRYVLKKEISSRKFYVTPHEIVYKVSRPSFIPFQGVVTIEKHVPLTQVLDVIIEQGKKKVDSNLQWVTRILTPVLFVRFCCLQSVYGIHTFRVESIAHGKTAPVDELQVQGVYNPGLLRKTIVTEAAKAIQEHGRTWKHIGQISEGDNMAGIGSFGEGPAILRSPVKTTKMPRHPSVEHRGSLPADLFLHKLEEVNISVKKIELLIEQSHASSDNN